MSDVKATGSGRNLAEDSEAGTQVPWPGARPPLPSRAKPQRHLLI